MSIPPEQAENRQDEVQKRKRRIHYIPLLIFLVVTIIFLAFIGFFFPGNFIVSGIRNIPWSFLTQLILTAGAVITVIGYFIQSFKVINKLEVWFRLLINFFRGSSNKFPSPPIEALPSLEEDHIRITDVLESHSRIPDSHRVRDTLSIIRIRIMQDPLTAWNFIMITSAITELYTKCWLIKKGRFVDLFEYTQTHNIRFDKEANLIVTKLAYNSPGLIEFPDPEHIGNALEKVVDTATQVGLRYKKSKLDIKEKELEMKLKELQAQSELEDKKQKRELEAQKAELEKQRMQLELEKMQLEVQKQRIELAEQQLALEKKLTEYRLERISMVIDDLHPGVDVKMKQLIARSMLDNMLMLDNAEGLEILLISEKQEDAKKTEEAT